MVNLNFNPFPILTTERLILRQLEMTDDMEIQTLRSDERVNEFLNRAKSNNIDQAREFIKKINNGVAQNESLYWAISLKNESKLIGTVCLWNIVKQNSAAEIGYELHPDFQGKGIMQEALSKVIDYGFQTMNLTTIEAYTHPANDKSSNLLKKFDFRRKMDPEHESDSKEVIYSLSKSQDLKENGSSA